MVRQIPVHHRDHPGHFALVDDEDYTLVTQYKWYLKVHRWPTVYACTSKSLQMQALILPNRPDGLVRHHKNGNGLDNRRENLEFTTPARNSQIRWRINSNNKSGHTGIRHLGIRRWQAYLDGIYLGTFLTLDRAIVAREAAKAKYRGED